MPGAEKLSLLAKQDSQIKHLTEPVVTTIEEIVRPIGYAIEGLICVRAVVEGYGRTAEGWGTGTKELAPLKAVSEAIERLVMFSKVESDASISSSNGWAAHTDELSARKRATAELVERDTAMRTWFDGGPYFLIPKTFWPETLLRWSKQANADKIEFASPTVLLSEGPYGACLSVLLQTSDLRTVVGHASGPDITNAIESAFFESLRSAHAALRFEEFAEVSDLHGEGVPTVNYGPGANGMAYAYGAAMPSLQLVELDSSEVASKWIQHQSKLKELVSTAEYDVLRAGNRFVVRSKISGIMEVFWGRTPESMNVKNSFPHFVG